MEQQAQAQEGEMPFTPQNAGILARFVRARMRARERRRERKNNEALRRAAFSFSLFPSVPEADYEREADEIWRQSWEDVGDCLRLAMFDYAAGKRE